MMSKTMPDASLVAALFIDSPDAVVIADAERRVVACNPAFSAMFGYAEAELLGRSTKTFYADPDDFDNQGARYFNTGKPLRNGAKFVQYRRKSGGSFPSETVATQIRNAAGEIIGFVGVIRDMSDMIDMIVELKQDNRALIAELDAVKGAAAAGSKPRS